MSEESKITWRTLRTYQETNGKCRIFKKDFRYRRAIGKLAKVIGPSKIGLTN